MAFFNETYCQFCEKFITEEQWDKHLYSTRHLHREVNGYWPAYFPQRKLARDEGSILEKAFCETIFGSEDVLPAYGFLKTYIMMATNMKNYLTLDDNDVDSDFSYGCRDVLIAQFKQGLYKKSFSRQDQDNCEDVLQKVSNFGFSMLLIWLD